MSFRSRNEVERPKRGNYRKNHGLPGVVYILANPGLRDGWWKIGCSTRSGAQRARELNNDATTGTPGIFHCIFEQRTLNCGLAEEQVFATLAESRKGKWGHEYFAVDIQTAKETIRSVCRQIDDASSSPAPPPVPTPSMSSPLTPAHQGHRLRHRYNPLRKSKSTNYQSTTGQVLKPLSPHQSGEIIQNDSVAIVELL